MINMIWAQTHDGVIGSNNQVPWHVPEDLKFFRHVTGKDPILMGRRTWDSLPAKPLYGRHNIVMSRKEIDVVDVTTVNSVQQVLDMKLDILTVIGGAEIYKLFMPYADRLFVTTVFGLIKGDTYAPEFDLDEWEHYEPYPKSESISGLNYKIDYYERRVI